MVSISRNCLSRYSLLEPNDGAVGELDPSATDSAPRQASRLDEVHAGFSFLVSRSKSAYFRP
jgi:hypothetical protein